MSEPSKLDERQVLQNVHDENRQTLRVDASVFINGEGTSGDSISIVDEDGHKLNITEEGKLEIDIGNLTFTDDKVDVSGSQVELGSITINELQDIQDTGNILLQDIKDNILITNDTLIDSQLTLEQIEINTQNLASSLKQDTIISELQNINNSQIILNIKEQILRAIDREQDITYADFGTKDQRITEISYISSSVGSQIAKKTITYSLVGNKYRRDSIIWSII